MTASTRLLAAIRACYWIEGSDEQWLTQILRILLLETHSARGMAWFFRADRTGLIPQGVVEQNCPMHQVSAFLELTSSPALRLALDRGRDALANRGTRGWCWSVEEQPLFERWRHTCPSLRDSLTLWAMDREGTGCVLVIPDWMARDETRWHPARQRHFAEHLASGFWIRRGARTALCRLLEDSPASATWKELAIQTDRQFGRQFGRHSGRQPGRQPGLGNDRGDIQDHPTGAETAVAVCDGLLRGLWILLGHWEHDDRRHVLTYRRKLPISPAAPRLTLTAREREILRLAMRPLDYRTYKEIGQALGCRSNTIANHMARMLRKIGVTTHAELLAVLAPLATARHGHTGPHIILTSEANTKATATPDRDPG